MKRRIIGFSTVMLLLVGVVSGCSKGAEDEADNQTKTTDQSSASQVQTAVDGHATVNTVALTEGEYSEEELDDSWSKEKATIIALDDETIEITGAGAQAEGSTVTISAAGEYVISGELSEGRIFVQVADKGDVKLILNNASITSSEGPVIEIEEGNTIITLVAKSKNYIVDNTVLAAEETEETTDQRRSGAIHGKDDLVFNGTGSLTVTANYKNGIQSSDDLKFVSGSYTIEAVNHGLVGKDCIMIKDGNFAITSGSDGMQATNIEESDQGYIVIDGGELEVTAGADAIQAETLLLLNDGEFNLVTAGGSVAVEPKAGEAMGGGFRPEGERGERPADMEMPSEGERGERPTDMEMPPEGEAPTDMGTPPEGERPTDMEMPPEGERPTDEAVVETAEEAEETAVSSKGLKAYVDLIVTGGNFKIDSYDDGLHSNDKIAINGGTFTISAGDDGIHADQELAINDGEIEVLTSYEGLEGYSVAINGGQIDVKASDDGVNAAQKTAANSTDESRMGGSQGAVITINGGALTVDAEGDGVDANGRIEMTGGTLLVQGPINGGNGTYDFDEEFIITGGTVMSVGTPQMAQSAGEDSTQAFITGTFSETIPAQTEVTVTDESGGEMLTFTTAKESSWYMFSAPELKAGSSYTVQAGGVQELVAAQ